jgi:hypothetical protein
VQFAYRDAERELESESKDVGVKSLLQCAYMHSPSLFVQLTAIALCEVIATRATLVACLPARGCNKFASANWGRLGEPTSRFSCELASSKADARVSKISL